MRSRSSPAISDPYEEPESPEIRVETHDKTPEESAAQILGHLEAEGLIPAKS